jgi:glycosyltransferase involved in cell wall biosynthesis
VHWLGEVSDEQLWCLYRRALAVCIPSTVEGFGLPAIEAMAVGTPVIGSEAGALPEVIGDGGVTVPALEPELWAGAIATVCDERLRSEFSKRALERASQYSWEASATRLAQLLEAIA